jgi:hypothetical protein
MEHTENLNVAVPKSIHRAVKQETPERRTSMVAVVIELLQPLMHYRNGVQK